MPKINYLSHYPKKLKELIKHKVERGYSKDKKNNNKKQWKKSIKSKIVFPPKR